MTLTLLHISDQITQEDFSASELAQLFRTQGIQAAALLVSGITTDGSEDQFKKGLDELRKLQAYLELTSREVLVLPNVADLGSGYLYFTTHFFKPLKNQPFCYREPQVLLLDRSWQILTQHTVYWRDFPGPSSENIQMTFAMGRDHLVDRNLPFIQTLFCYHPPDQWKVTGGVGQLNKERTPHTFILSGLCPSDNQPIPEMPVFGDTAIRIYRYQPGERLLTIMPVVQSDQHYLIGEQNTHEFK